MNLESDLLRIASFDIAKGNFGQYVEDTPIPNIESLRKKYHKIPTALQRRVKGKMNTCIEKILKEIYLSGNRIQFGVYDFRSKEGILDIGTRRNLLSHLRSFEDLWDTCDIIVIEQQYFQTFPRGRRRKGGGANVDAIKLGEATFIWFLDNYPFKEILYFGSQFKTQVLGAPWKLKDKERKKWSSEKAYEIYKMRDDKDAVAIYDLKETVKRKRMTSEDKIRTFIKEFDSRPDDIKYMANKIVREKQKLDDISDACLQCQAYKYRNLVACF